MIVGLTQIRGVGYMFANTILNVLKINPNQRIGHLSPEQVNSIESIIKNPSASNFPSWFLNRRKDVETGEDKHLLTSDIAFTVRNDIEREKTSGSWRGIRHMFGLKVRGQRTRCTGRKGGAVGVAKGGKVMPTREGAPCSWCRRSACSWCRRSTCSWCRRSTCSWCRRSTCSWCRRSS